MINSLLDTKIPTIVGIDLGRGSVKVSYNEIEYEFPSTLKFLGTKNVGVHADSDDNIYKYKGKLYLVGDDSNIENSICSKGDDFLFTYAPLLIFHALKKINVDMNEPIHLALGLSKLEKRRESNFVSIIKNFTINKKYIEFQKIDMFFQGEGIFFDQCKTSSLKGYQCVIDIGYHSLDFLVFDDGRYRDDLSFSVEKGVYIIVFALQKFINKISLRVNITENQAKKAFMEQSIVIYGEKINLTKEIAVIVKEYLLNIIDYIEGMSSNFLASADKVIISGGGANLFDKDSLHYNFKIGKQKTIFANARGYRYKVEQSYNNK